MVEPDEAQVNVTVVRRGCGSGCGTVLVVLLVAGLAVAAFGWLVAHWYVPVAVTAVVAVVWVVVAGRDPYRHVG